MDGSKARHLNNPKIPAKFVISNDVLIYGDKPKTIGNGGWSRNLKSILSELTSNRRSSFCFRGNDDE